MDGATLAEIAHERWGIDLRCDKPGRFQQSGWTYEFGLDVPCPQCATELECCRKPYVTSSGREQKFVALPCPGCGAVHEMKELGFSGFAGVSRRARDAAQPRPAEQPRPVAQRSTEESVLRFWHAVEHFDVQPVALPDAKDRSRGSECTRHLLTEGAPWWNPDVPWRRRTKKGQLVARYTVRAGLFAVDDLYTTLAPVLGEAGEDVDERTPRGRSALFSVEVDACGVPDLDSVTLNSAVWALGRLLRGAGTHAPELEGLEEDRTSLAEQLADRLGKRPQRGEVPPAAQHGGTGDEEIAPLTVEDVARLVDDAAAFLGVRECLAPYDAVSEKRMVDPEDEPARGGGFLNSMIVDDLRRIAEDLAQHDAPPALRRYLSPGGEAEGRVDVADEAHRMTVLQTLHPQAVPAGRWPSEPSQPLSTSQQLAVDHLLDDGAEETRVVGVNGPPGTGKSTLLRDVVADQVTRRAEVLAAFDDPSDAFAREKIGWRTAHWDSRFTPLDPRLAGFEMIVASANNNAVENISRELPQREQLAPRWRDHGYFTDAARRMAPGDAGDADAGDADAEDGGAWGLLSAVLGKKANRGAFHSAVWWGETTEDFEDTRPQFVVELSARSAASTQEDWRQAVAAFREARRREERLRRRRGELADRHAALIAAARDVDQAESALGAAQAARRQQETRVEEAQALEREALDTVRPWQERHHRLRAEKPGWWRWLWDFGERRRSWQAEAAQVEDILAEARRRHAEARADRQAAEEDLAAAEEDCVAAAQEERDRCASRARRREQWDAARADFAGAVPHDAWRPDADDDELHPLWADEEWNAARSELFLAALALHEAFIVATWSRGFGKGLSAAMELVRSGAPRDASAHDVAEAWRFLFLLVPVVSTTFSSLGRMFAGVPREAFGRLIVDEAGQAPPQAAVGGIWRTRRTVAVGDPLQLEPIVGALHSTQAQLRDQWGLGDEWMPGGQSVQRLADRTTTFGAWFPDAEGDLWVGAPLRAHRRCDDPMFSIVDGAVYGGAMVLGAPARAASQGLRETRLPSSAWIDVVSGASQGKWRPEEGEVLLDLVHQLLSGEAARAPADIIVLSPFRAVADEAKRTLREAGIPVVTARSDGVTVGTVHTAQGRQADVVIFLLGSALEAEGSRQWAAEKPNLVNVAVSRAKLRFYVIGQRSHWSGLPYFSAAAAGLDGVDRSAVPGRKEDARSS